jgi:hypothetical protein
MAAGEGDPCDSTPTAAMIRAGTGRQRQSPPYEHRQDRRA